MLELIDNSQLNTAELSEQCLALTYILSVVEHSALKETITFILLEKQSALRFLLCTGTEHE
ncbi:hypothetical protein [Budvicia diplopodorum]|uniref:hypothetical protein n=1 Tax=Budvicia diplopodorum TaxID=1119056 RepID=UPI001357927F|nr:hypothetical protein [Budvicia diplopodorum]